MKTIQMLLLSLVLVPSMLWAQDEAAGEPNEVVVAVSDIPERVMATAKEAKPGAFVTQALKQLRRNDETYYRIYASQVGRYWVIVVRADGELVRVFESPNPPGSLMGS
ncbi:MAG: hypothetical protein QNI86_09335 [Halieaceae bacterium]|nr:hypothetical protein [Halieaceae bacterium]